MAKLTSKEPTMNLINDIIVGRIEKCPKSIFLNVGELSFWPSVHFLSILTISRSFFWEQCIRSEVTLNPLEHVWSLCDMTCREGWALKTPRCCRGLSTLFNSIDVWYDIQSSNDCRLSSLTNLVPEIPQRIKNVITKSVFGLIYSSICSMI